MYCSIVIVHHFFQNNGSENLGGWHELPVSTSRIRKAKRSKHSFFVCCYDYYLAPEGEVILFVNQYPNGTQWDAKDVMIFWPFHGAWSFPFKTIFSRPSHCPCPHSPRPPPKKKKKSTQINVLLQVLYNVTCVCLWSTQKLKVCSADYQSGSR